MTLDRWHSAPGDQIPVFMERAVRENNFVIAVCTPRFKEGSDGRSGGVGYEGDIMTAEVFTGGNQRKFIPILRSGDWNEAAPSWLHGKAYINLKGDPYSEAQYEDLLRTLHGAREECATYRTSAGLQYPASRAPKAHHQLDRHEARLDPSGRVPDGRAR